jgi:type I restriction enzyme, S subunit
VGEAISFTFGALVRDGTLEIGDGYRAKLDELGGEGPFFLRAGALTDRGFVWGGLESFHCEARTDGKHGQPGDVVITTKGNSVGRVGQIPKGAPEFVYSPHLSYWRPLDETRICAQYLYYWARDVEFNVQLRQLAFGTDMAPYFSLRDQLRLTISLPPISRQRAIAQMLGALDDKIVANEDVANVALELGDRLFTRAAAKSGRVPTSVGELAERSAIEFSDGYRTKRIEHGQPGLRILRAGDVRDSYVYPAGDDYVSLDYSRQIGSKASIPGDIVLTTKGTVGRVAVMAEPVERVVYSPQVCYFRVKDDSQLDRGYLGAWFRSSDLQRQAATLMYKSDMAPYISLRDIRSLIVPLPPIEEQRRIGEVQGNLLAAFDASRVENELLARTRDALLPLLMSGKVTVRSAEEILGGVV